MSEKLIIKNFGPIKSAEIELKRFTVLIGEQATGKSTIAKLLAVCRYFSYIGPPQGHYFVGLQGLEQWGLNGYRREDSFIQYQNEDYRFEIESESINVATQRTDSEYMSERFKKLFNEAAKYNGPLPPSFFQNNVASVMENPFFLPVERGLQSIFSLGKDSIQNISDSLFNQLAKIDQVARTFTKEILIEPLGISYKNEAGRGFVKKENDDKFYSLNNAASGYQSTIPIVVACKYYHENEFRKKSKTFIIEEPELNLFPISQKNLIDFLVHESNKVQQNQAHSQFLLTTHSPYILTSLNNCMYAYKIGKDNHEKTNKIVPEANWLNSDDVSCYMLKADGTAEDILDRESSLIDVEKIDGISETLNEEFDELLKIEFTDK